MLTTEQYDKAFLQFLQIYALFMTVAVSMAITIAVATHVEPQTIAKCWLLPDGYHAVGVSSNWLLIEKEGHIKQVQLFSLESCPK